MDEYSKFFNEKVEYNSTEDYEEYVFREIPQVFLDNLGGDRVLKDLIETYMKSGRYIQDGFLPTRTEEHDVSEYRNIMLCFDAGATGDDIIKLIIDLTITDSFENAHAALLLISTLLKLYPDKIISQIQALTDWSNVVAVEECEPDTCTSISELYVYLKSCCETIYKLFPNDKDEDNLDFIEKWYSYFFQCNVM